MAAQAFQDETVANPARAKPAAPPVPAPNAIPIPRPSVGAASTSASTPSTGVGATVGGTRVFSDGSGSIARTLTSGQMSSLGGAPPSPLSRTLSNATANATASPNSSSFNLPRPTPGGVGGAMVNGVRTFSDGSGSIPRTLTLPPASPLGGESVSKPEGGYYGNPNSPGYDSGFAQLGRALSRAQEDNAVRANPVGPPSLLTPPSPNNDLRAGVRVDPTATDLSREGALRPASGNFSASNPQPLVDAVGKVMAPASSLLAPGLSSPPDPTSHRQSLALPPATNSLTSAIDAKAFSSGSATTAPQATSINGRPLGYGAMTQVPRSLSSASVDGMPYDISGGGSSPIKPVMTDAEMAALRQPSRSPSRTTDTVRVFSDGTGSVPATMTKAQIAALGNESRLTRADVGTGGGIGSEAFRIARPTPNAGASASILAGTPELGSAAGYALTRPTPQQGGVFHMPPAANQAASDLASIIGRDTRSPLGLAMRNADAEAKGRIKPRRVETAAALAAPALEGLRQAGALEQEGMQQAGANARTNVDAASRVATTGMNNQAELQRAFANRPTPTQVPLADGSLGLLGQDGVVRPATDARGNSVRPRNQPSAEEIKTIDEHTRLLLGIDKDSGLKRDGTAPTAHELKAASAAARAASNAVSEAQARMQQQTADDQAEGEATQQALMQKFTTGAVYADANGNHARWNGRDWEHL